MKNQKEINPEMRSILNNWLIEVHDKFNYKEQTLFVCINIIDRYLSIKIIERSNYQLLGISALFIACKHEEVNLPNPKDFLFITENAYNSEQLYKMEYDILKCINFEILIPTQLDFFLSISYKFNLDEKEDLLGKYLLNICLLDYTLIKYPFSIIACSCLYICMKWFKKKIILLYLNVIIINILIIIIFLLLILEIVLLIFVFFLIILLKLIINLLKENIL